MLLPVYKAMAGQSYSGKGNALIRKAE